MRYFRRTAGKSIGRGALTLESSAPSASEPFTVTPMVTGGYKHGSRAVVTFDPKFTTFVWAEFHNGVAAALRIPRGAKGIDQSWIHVSLTADKTVNAGLFFGLGLNGHLGALNKVYIRKQYESADAVRIVALMLGTATALSAAV